MMSTRQSSSRKAGKSSSPAKDLPKPVADLYLIDFAQRTALFLDALLDRGNNYVEHLDKGTPPLLKFDYELVTVSYTHLTLPTIYSV